MCAMCWLRKRWSPTQTTDRNHSFAVLRHAIIRRVDLPNVNAVSGFQERCKQVQDETPARPREEPLHVFKDERLRFHPCNESCEDRYEGIARIVAAPLARRREPLTRRTACNNGTLRDFGEFRDAAPHYVATDIRPVGVYSRLPVVHGADHSKASALEAEGKAACATEKVYQRWSLIVVIHDLVRTGSFVTTAPEPPSVNQVPHSILYRLRHRALRCRPVFVSRLVDRLVRAGIVAAALVCGIMGHIQGCRHARAATPGGCHISGSPCVLLLGRADGSKQSPGRATSGGSPSGDA